MKRITALLLTVILVFILVSCSGVKPSLDRNDEMLSEKWISGHHYLYYNENCVHDIAYKRISDMRTSYNESEYHYIYCQSGNCDFKPRIEKHSQLIIRNFYQAQMAENGSYYHMIYVNCPGCKMGFNAAMYLCQTQRPDCDGQCLSELKGKEYTP